MLMIMMVMATIVMQLSHMVLNERSKDVTKKPRKESGLSITSSIQHDG